MNLDHWWKVDGGSGMLGSTKATPADVCAPDGGLSPEPTKEALDLCPE